MAFLILDLRRDILRKLLDNVVGLRGGKAALDGFEIAIDDFHNGSLYAAGAQYREPDLAKLERNLYQREVNLLDGAPRRRTKTQQEGGSQDRGRFRADAMKSRTHNYLRTIPFRDESMLFHSARSCLSMVLPSADRI